MHANNICDLLCGVIDDVIVRRAGEHLLELGYGIVRRDLFALLAIEKCFNIETGEWFQGFTASTCTFDFRWY
jgi:hypothetical protein